MGTKGPKAALITDTTFRDAHQSLLATRMKTEHMIPIAEKHDEIGFYSMEMWGGATFDTCMRFCGDDPWERLRVIRRHLKKTKTQMLLRGQNIVGYRNYADDVLIEFIKKAVFNGMDIFRCFDALNDYRNLEVAIKTVIDEVALRIDQALDDNEREQWKRLLETQDRAQMQAFLTERGLDVPNLITQEALKYKAELLALVQLSKKQQ